VAIEVTYRRTSRLSMRIVKNGDVHVSVPLGTPRDRVRTFIEEHEEWLEDARQRQAEAVRRRVLFYARLPLDTPARRCEAEKRLRELVRPQVERYSREMGVRPDKVSFRRMRSRWGCCCPATHEIRFSLYLLLLPGWCVEHVVVHELAHLLVPDHGARFYTVMNRFFPRWKEARETTRRICRLEEE